MPETVQPLSNNRNQTCIEFLYRIGNPENCIQINLYDYRRCGIGWLPRYEGFVRVPGWQTRLLHIKVKRRPWSQTGETCNDTMG